MNAVAPLVRSLGMDVEDAKQALRKSIRARRSARSRRDQEHLAAALTQQIVRECADAQTVCMYVSVDHEPDTLAALEALAARGKEILVPVLGPRLSRTWGRYRGAADLAQRNPGRPPEPSGDVLPAEAIGRCDVILTPAIAAGSNGARLGQGGGWYDRVLQHRSPTARVLATVFDDEVYDDLEIPVETHDVYVDAILTPTRVIEAQPV